jgi:hypothetical protein
VKCPNCETDHDGNFCPHCGQSTTDFNQPFREIFRDFLNSVLNLDSRLLRTLIPILFRPGFLTREFLAGRRVRYISPSRLYFVSSFFFFLLVALVGLVTVSTNTDRELNFGDTTVVGFGSPQESESSTESADSATEDEAASPPPIEIEPSGPSGTTGEGDISTQSSGFSRIMESAGQKISENPRLMLEGLVDAMPFAIFLLLPVFALLLKGFYFRRGIHYLTHLVFSLNLHAFFFLFASILMLLNAVLPDWTWSILNIAANIYFCVYFFLALKTVYGQSILKTTLKWFLVGVSYSIVLATSTAGLVVVTLLFIGLR